MTLTGRGPRPAGSTSATCRTTSPPSSRSTTASGALLDYLDATGLAKNTIVIYTSDQGFFLGDHGMYDKRFMYEESLRMPFLVRWPAGIKAGSRGATRWRSTSTSRRRSSTPPACPCRRTCRAGACCPSCAARTPADWRTSMYYRYYHDPGDHNTRAHYGVRTVDAQADLLLEEGPVGAVRPGERPGRAAQPVRPARARADHRRAEGRACAAEAGGAATKTSSPTSSCRTAWTVRSRGCAGSDSVVGHDRIIRS